MSQNVAPTRGERRREITRRKLLDAGRALIGERGVAGLRIQEITELADVALGSFYNYFPAKEDLVEAVVAESLSSLAAATLPAEWDDADPAEVVAAANMRFVQLAGEDPEFARLVVNLVHADDLFLAATYPYARTALERGIDAGRFVVADIEVALTAIIGAALALIRELLAGRHKPGAELAFAGLVLASLGLNPREAAEVAAKAADRLQG
ncbi:TetR/AcrR family transcriptional regulator [Antrihabitans sp. YC2-6]|uniref:TetR/AcrR family transcriptional regulator n=1 Tax=Antrihabitans sp. YC2-6 TaxID=2799498 RepID=UPI0018F3D0DA|nr:TetR/AcrR family transcriptional regulator [Antrihabitans sp. YC2-6]MBJ8345200.1 TetR/AcrR family transcriptional regulator [Antrihabitans sp. YC2-6]